MSYFDEISLDNLDNEELIEQQHYQDYLRKQNVIDTEENEIFMEKFLKSKLCVLALKQLPDLEKRVFFLSVIKKEKLNSICESLNLSKVEVSKLKQIASQHFIENLKELKNSSNKVGGNNE